VLRDGRPSGHDFRIAAHQVFRAHAGFHVQKIGIAVQVVKILQKREIQRVAHVLVRFALGQAGGQVNG